MMSLIMNISVALAQDYDVIDHEHFSSFSKVLRITAWVLKFMANSRLPKTQRITDELSFDELCKAKVQIFRNVQNIAYLTEFTALQQGKRIPKSSPIFQLSPFVGQGGLLQVKGRLQLSNLVFEEKHPIILPDCYLVRLLLKFQHLLLKHAGVGTMITSLRARYWIVRLRSIAKTVKRECVSCKKHDVQACNQPSGPLPKLRIQQAPLFTVTGLDYAGPLFCIDHPKKKLYILLFTCAVVRAVYLELTVSLSLSDFVLALRRFAARLGLPKFLFSDNAKTFTSAHFRLKEYFGHLSPQWNFIVPRSPWWGGWWERLIRSVKSALKKSIGVSCLSRSELETTLHEIEASINSRPLTFVGDSLGANLPLTPSYFLTGKLVGFQPETSDFSEVIVSPKDLSSQDIDCRQRLDHFWSSWSSVYLRNLPPTVNRFFPRGDLKVGSVVLIREDNVPRLKWPLGRVQELFPGKDGVTHIISLKTAKGVETRSIRKLHDLEVNDQTVSSEP